MPAWCGVLGLVSEWNSFNKPHRSYQLRWTIFHLIISPGLCKTRTCSKFPCWIYQASTYCICTRNWTEISTIHCIQEWQRRCQLASLPDIATRVQAIIIFFYEICLQIYWRTQGEEKEVGAMYFCVIGKLICVWLIDWVILHWSRSVGYRGLAFCMYLQVACVCWTLNHSILIELHTYLKQFLFF